MRTVTLPNLLLFRWCTCLLVLFRFLLIPLALIEDSKYISVYGYTWTGPPRQICQGVRRSIPGPLASGALVETCIGCWHSNQSVDETISVTIPRFRNRLDIIVATRPVARGSFGAMPPQLFYVPPYLVFLRIICFKHIIKTKLFPPENVFCHLKP